MHLLDHVLNILPARTDRVRHALPMTVNRRRGQFIFTFTIQVQLLESIHSQSTTTPVHAGATQRAIRFKQSQGAVEQHAFMHPGASQYRANGRRAGGWLGARAPDMALRPQAGTGCSSRRAQKAIMCNRMVLVKVAAGASSPEIMAVFRWSCSNYTVYAKTRFARVTI